MGQRRGESAAGDGDLLVIVVPPVLRLIRKRNSKPQVDIANNMPDSGADAPYPAFSS